MSNPKRNATPASTPAELEFDVTQQIDPALTDLLPPGSEPTLTQVDFDDIELAIEPSQPPASHRR